MPKLPEEMPGKVKKAPPDIRTMQQREMDEVRLISLLARGYSFTTAALEMKLSRSTIINDYRRFTKRHFKIAEAEEKARRFVVLRQLEEVKREAWLMWERSKENSLKITEDDAGQINPDGSMVTRTTTTTETKCGDPRYLNIVKDVIKDERELLGLDAPKRVNVQANLVDWGAIAQEIGRPALSMEEMIEQQLARRKVEALEVKPLGERLPPVGEVFDGRVADAVSEDGDHHGG